MELKKIEIRALSRAAGDRRELDPASPCVQQLFEAVSGSFGRRSALTHGAFGEESLQEHPFAGALLAMTGALDEADLGNLADVALSRLLESASAEQPDDEQDSQLVCLLYQSDRYHYLLLALLEHETRLGLDATLQPVETRILAAERLVQALRVNLTRLERGQDSYLSFVPGKRNGSVGQDFPGAFGCSEAVPASHCTRELIRATRDYCNQRQLHERKDEVVEDVVSYLERQREDKQHASLNEIERLFDAYIPPEQAESSGTTFGQFANTEPYQVTQEFQPHSGTLRALGKVKTKSDNWQLDFARRSLGPKESDRDILFDEEGQTLTLRRLPTRVIQTIREALEQE
ncbi:nucleoid-associated protein [Marinobacterium aestuariivivens]|uniref:Nucleoid-associated protein n=1 Tax=Marinobacterium aestuariivivens TaxID=1698799 RepID=A0ABW2A4J7_9GAMM